MIHRSIQLGLKLLVLLGAFVFLGTFAVSAEAGVKNPVKNLGSVGEKQNYLPILNRWSGDYPIAQLDRLREWHAQSHAGYIGDEAAFASFWQVFKQGTAVPRVDFSKNIVVFVIGNGLYWQMFVAKVTIQDGFAEMVADGNTSGQPRDDSLAAALAVVPRAGVKFVRWGKEQVAVE
jgi:hypothetical protein